MGRMSGEPPAGRIGVVVFPGSNCDHDAYHVVKHVLGSTPAFVWHKETELPPLDAVILPGGFAYGDYLRAGALAARSPVMGAVRAFAAKGGPVLGICNGFQVLVESGLLPGALLRNRGLKFIHQPVHLKVENAASRFTSRCRSDRPLSMPISHAEGNYHADEETLNRLEGEGRVAFRYCDSRGRLTDESNVNGSQRAIAGILNEAGNVLGLMPHPDRAAEAELGSDDGRAVFESLLASLDGAR
jgi:phosphoribosylformylglycinamidine synthase subunit PurQ / glutaminase